MLFVVATLEKEIILNVIFVQNATNNPKMVIFDSKYALKVRIWSTLDETESKSDRKMLSMS